MHDLVLRSCQAAIRDVMENGVVEENAVLRDNGNSMPKAVQGHVTNILVTHKDPAIPWVVESVQETYNCGLAV